MHDIYWGKLHTESLCSCTREMHIYLAFWHLNCIFVQAQTVPADVNELQRNAGTQLSCLSRMAQTQVIGPHRRISLFCLFKGLGTLRSWSKGCTSPGLLCKPQFQKLSSFLPKAAGYWSLVSVILNCRRKKKQPISIKVKTIVLIIVSSQKAQKGACSSISCWEQRVA